MGKKIWYGKRKSNYPVECFRGVDPARFSDKEKGEAWKEAADEKYSSDKELKHIFVRRMDEWIGITLTSELDFHTFLNKLKMFGLVAEEQWQIENSEFSTAKVKAGKWRKNYSMTSSGLFSSSSGYASAEEESKGEDEDDEPGAVEAGEASLTVNRLQGGMIVTNYHHLVAEQKYRPVDYRRLEEWRPLMHDSHPSDIDITYLFQPSLRVYDEYYVEFGDFDIPEGFVGINGSKQLSHTSSALAQMTEFEKIRVKPKDYRGLYAAPSSEAIMISDDADSAGPAIVSSAAVTSDSESGEIEKKQDSDIVVSGTGIASEADSAPKLIAIRHYRRWLRIQFEKAEEFDALLEDTQSMGLVNEETLEVIRVFSMLEPRAHYRLQPWTVDQSSDMFNSNISSWFHNVAERKKKMLSKRRKDEEKAAKRSGGNGGGSGSGSGKGSGKGSRKSKRGSTAPSSSGWSIFG